MMTWFQNLGGRVSSVFLSPQFFWFAGLIPVVILLYLLKLRRTNIIIASTFLWVKSLQDLTANAPFQRLRKNLLLILQLIILILAITALARPFVRAEGVRGASFGVLIDRSASMQTLEAGTARLDLAKQVALKMVDDMTRGDRIMIVSFAESAEVLCELTDDKFRLRRAINSIEPSDMRTNIRDVMSVASSLAPDNPDIPAVVSDLELILLSDGNLSDIDELGARAISVTYLKIGETTNNAGIVGFSLRNPLDGTGSQQTFVQVHNESATPMQTTLSLYFNGGLLKVEEIGVPPGEDREIIFAHEELGEGILHVELDQEDDLVLDNRAWLTIHPATKVRVLYVGENDTTSAYYLKRVLALEQRVALSAVEPANYAPSDDYDLTIFDGYVPENEEGVPSTDAFPGGALVFFNAMPPLPGLVSEGDIENPPVLATEPDHPATRFLNPGNILIEKAFRVVLPDGSRTLISTTRSALIADVSRGGQQILMTTFDIADSDWPLKLSFPIFIQNLVSWAPRGALSGEMSTPTGRPLTLIAALAEVGVEQAELKAIITAPDGSTHEIELDSLRPTYFGNTERAGVYRVAQGTQTSYFAVNLLDVNESSIRPEDSIQFGRVTVVAEEGGLKQTRELWRWFIAAALGVLALEWWVYSRRAWL